MRIPRDEAEAISRQTPHMLSMHKGRFHTDRSSTRDGVGTSMERPNLIDDNKGQAVDSQGEYNGKVPRSYEANVEGMVTSKGGSSENNNSVHLRNQSVSKGQVSSNVGLVGGRQEERVVQEDEAGTSSSVANFVKDGVPGVGSSRGGGGRSMSPTLSVFRFVCLGCLSMHESDLFNASCFSDASDVSSTVGGVMVGKTLVMVDMMLQNLVTRVTYRVMSAAPISIIIPKVRL